jgi:hypothetical protein
VRVTRVPLSADGSFLICLKPRRATTLSGFWTVVVVVGLDHNKYQTLVLDNLLKQSLVHEEKI